MSPSGVTRNVYRVQRNSHCRGNKFNRLNRRLHLFVEKEVRRRKDGSRKYRNEIQVNTLDFVDREGGYHAQEFITAFKRNGFWHNFRPRQVRVLCDARVGEVPMLVQCEDCKSKWVIAGSDQVKISKMIAHQMHRCSAFFFKKKKFDGNAFTLRNFEGIRFAVRYHEEDYGRSKTWLIQRADYQVQYLPSGVVETHDIDTELENRSYTPPFEEYEDNNPDNTVEEPVASSSIQPSGVYMWVCTRRRGWMGEQLSFKCEGCDVASPWLYNPPRNCPDCGKVVLGIRANTT